MFKTKVSFDFDIVWSRLAILQKMCGYIIHNTTDPACSCVLFWHIKVNTSFQTKCSQTVCTLHFMSTFTMKFTSLSFFSKCAPILAMVLLWFHHTVTQTTAIRFTVSRQHKTLAHTHILTYTHRATSWGTQNYERILSPAETRRAITSKLTKINTVVSMNVFSALYHRIINKVHREAFYGLGFVQTTAQAQCTICSERKKDAANRRSGSVQC